MPSGHDYNLTYRNINQELLKRSLKGSVGKKIKTRVLQAD